MSHKVKRIFVMMPVKYGLSKNEIDAFRKSTAKTAYKAMAKIGQYCELFTANDYFLSDKPKDEQAKLRRLYVVDCVKSVCRCDYVAFGEGWQDSGECCAVRNVAHILNVSEYTVRDFNALGSFLHILGVVICNSYRI